MKQNTASTIACWLLMALGLAAASSCNNGKNGPAVSNIQVKLETYRFDKDLYAIDTNHIGEGLQQLASKYPDFLNFYLDTMLAYGIHGNYSDTARPIREGLRVLLTYKDYVALEDTIKQHFPDTKDIEAELVKGFQHMKYYYPAYRIPKIIYTNLTLSKLPAFTIDTVIAGICLDMFLGPQYPYYRSVGVPAYMAPHLRPDYIPVALFTVIYSNKHPFVQDDRTLLDMIIQRGKEQYFLHKILPDMPDSTLFAFTGVQMEWCQKNEALIYNFFVQQNLLFNKESNSTIPYVYDGPYAKGLESPTEPIKKTPGNLGTWLGYKIVSAYVAQHPGMALSELLDKPVDPARILEEAKYRPK